MLKNTSILILNALLLVGAASQSGAQPPPEREHKWQSHGNGNPRRPAERWFEMVEKRDPEEYKRLKELRQTNPEEFGKEIRKQLQSRVSERLFEASPKLHEFFNTLPVEEQQSVMQALRRMAYDGDTPPHRRLFDQERPPALRPDSNADSGNDASPAAPSEKHMPRAEMESAYDQRTTMYEKEIERISGQLENLRRMLAERKDRRERVISEHYKRPAPTPEP